MIRLEQFKMFFEMFTAVYSNYRLFTVLWAAYFAILLFDYSDLRNYLHLHLYLHFVLLVVRVISRARFALQPMV